MHASLLLLVVACGGKDVVPADAVRVQLFQNGEPLRLAPVYFSFPDGTLNSDTETDLDGVAEGRVGDVGDVTIVVADSLTTIYGVPAGVSLVYHLPYESTVLSPVQIQVGGSAGGSRYRVTDGCGGDHSVSSGFDSIDVPWKCIQETGAIDLVAWAENDARDVVSASSLLDLEVPIGGTDGVSMPFLGSIDTIDVDWIDAPDDRSVTVDARSVRDGRRHRGGRYTIRDVTGSRSLGAGPTGFADAVDVVFASGFPTNPWGGGGSALRASQVHRVSPGDRVSAVVADLAPAVQGSVDAEGLSVTIEHLREPPDARAIEVSLPLVDEDGHLYSWTGVGVADLDEVALPELPDHELSIDDARAYTITLVGSDAISTDEYLTRWALRDRLQGLAPVDDTAGAKWTWWSFVGP